MVSHHYPLREITIIVTGPLVTDKMAEEMATPQGVASDSASNASVSPSETSDTSLAPDASTTSSAPGRSEQIALVFARVASIKGYYPNRLPDKTATLQERPRNQPTLTQKDTRRMCLADP